ncbi:DUF4868 domain-containing protein [Verminephrobacter eiseniae]|uniref:DUF4868 domain-containing protein n=1 Tax=Verminephrobacter eiseniae TaxID=364317 RepID=UPI0022379CB2|nr:DUF4868 domain-containing protein [Verminephrobacter eiseniae]MCW5234478.1 DUF4868 domain-containing protein [Verminephrobacter eiseniae]MCW5293945.1 DUF4868 domain-containing protein [Verminephrobacter eiseniae]MCW8186040.1 DUF4868 domain-containing protein [Verminephrobacter eiseniae]MCW8222237.1 DUF4868 domain-containing protein [Verminephrobacter eiseniae]MCW8235279.1 DUF4868 domain-containing protein [Verminephrobacter eiseniae]
MITNEINRQLRKIKSIDFSKWGVTFWLIKRTMAQKDARYHVLRVDIESRLEQRFRGYLEDQLQSRDFHVSQYDFNNTDGDDTLFTIATDETDFVKIAAEINRGFNNQRVEKYEELLNSWAYITLFENNSERIYAWRKINADTQPKKIKSKNALFFRNHQLVDIEEKEIFMISPQYDFFVYEGTTFIANKRQFESSMNFREGMKTYAEEVLADFDKIFDDVGIIREFVGTNLHHLRKLSSIHKSEYYKKPNYMQDLIKVCVDEKWELRISNGKIIVEKETVELLLKLLNNDRLRSPIDGELFDASAKNHVAKISGT